MWSKSFISEYTTFDAQYAIELLHSLGSVFDNNYSTNENLRNVMIELAKRDNKCFYQLALHVYKKLQRNNSFDLTTVFNDEEFNAIYDFRKRDEENPDKTQLYDVAAVHVTPTSIRIMPLEPTQGHRALRHKAFNGINDFCLVYLKPDPPAKYVNKCNQFKNVFESGIEICNNRYHFLGVSNSQLREHSYWFIRATSLTEAHQKRQKLVNCNGITNIGKYVARLGLWFTKSNPTGIKLTYISDKQEFNSRVEQGDMCVTEIDDIKRNDYYFTDGNGLMSKGLARIIAERLDYLVKYEQNELYPSAYQIRMAGCKGVVIIDPESTLNQFYIKIRPSMNKFDYDEWDLDICEESRPIPTRLNNQIIILLSDLGTPNSVFLELQDKWFMNKKQPPHNKQNLLKNKLPLPVNECRYMFGCTLESKLESGQCFIRYQVVDVDGKPLKNPEFKTVVGPVIITKNPCPYAGDIMQLEAVDLPELDCLKDVIVFSTKGNRPDCNKIAGSDLDGDQYFVYWGQQLQLSETIEPLEYKTQSPSVNSTCITSNDVINYCLSLLGATSYGEIYNLHAIVVDKNQENHAKRTCQKLAIEMAEMFSAAIDSGKTGYQINKDRILEIRKIVGNIYPDFLMKKPSYQSQSILGILYRKALDFKNQNPKLFEGQEMADSINPSTKCNGKNFRFYVKVRTALNVDPHIIYQELYSIFGNNVPPKIIIEQWSDSYKKKDANATLLMESSTNASVEDTTEVSSLIDTNLHITIDETQENFNVNSDTNE
ncbi:unnamed protein product [Rotaria sp. Silwood2]|nr:unnamed protein product [Rotaria sp. Silwood2]CAF3147453.1 unnamed protein product [Rotaria sp. Silwood2]CAF4030967.1 unnamed protein product [Rotaria sp. Silwood2]